MFELVFLGTAAAVPSAERGLPALLVGHGPDRFLVDCGEGTQRQLLRAGIGFRGLGHVLLTHAHLDHVAGLAGLIATRALWGLSGGIEIIGSGETVDFVRRYLAVTVGTGNGYRLRRCARRGAVAARLAPRRVRGGASRDPKPRLPVRGGSAPSLACRTALGIGRYRTDRRDGRSLAGDPVTLADGRLIAPEMVQGPEVAGARLAVVGDVEEVASLTQQVRAADALSSRPRFSIATARLARSRGHLTAAAAAWLAREGGGWRTVADPYFRPIPARGDQRGSRRHFSPDADCRRFRPHLGRRALYFRKGRHLS